MENESKPLNWKVDAKLLKSAGSLRLCINRPNYITETDSTWNTRVYTQTEVVVLKEPYLNFITKPALTKESQQSLVNTQCLSQKLSLSYIFLTAHKQVLAY